MRLWARASPAHEGVHERVADDLVRRLRLQGSRLAPAGFAIPRALQATTSELKRVPCMAARPGRVTEENPCASSSQRRQPLLR